MNFSLTFVCYHKKIRAKSNLFAAFYLHLYIGNGKRILLRRTLNTDKYTNILHTETGVIFCAVRELER